MALSSCVNAVSDKGVSRMNSRSLFIIVLATLVLVVGGTGCQKDALRGQICVPGAFRCVEEGSPRAQICNTYGTVWVDSECDPQQVCVKENCDEGQNPELCVEECRDLICEPGSTVCGADHLYVYECDSTGTRMCFNKSCGAAPMNGVCYSGECVAVCSQEQKSYLGCEYYAADLDNANVPCGRDEFGAVKYCDAAASQYAVVISNPHPEKSAYVVISKGPLQNPDVPASVEGECFQPPLPNNYVNASVIPPKGIEIFELPRRDVNGTILARLAYRISSNIPVTTYQFNPLENEEVFSNDASVLLPTTTASKNYIVMTREQTFDSLKGFIAIIGVDELPTEVTVTVTSETLPGPGIPAIPKGGQYTATLHQYDVLNLETNSVGGDFTGSRVRSNRGVIVYAGSEASNAPNTSRCDIEAGHCENDPEISCTSHEPCTTPALITCCADHLEQQLFPVETWGKEYVAVRSFPRGGEKDVWRILASEDGTEVTLEPPVAVVPTLDATKWFEFETNEDFRVSGTKPILVGQFLAAEQAPNPGRDENDAGTGDPAFILTVPTRQFRDSYVFIAPDKYEFDYVSIAKKKGGSALLDGGEVEQLPGAIMADIPGTDWRAVRAPIADGFHTLNCVDTCSVMVHGYDRFVSYGYPGGLNLDQAD